MPHIPRDLVNRLCDELGDSDLARELREATRPDGNMNISLSVPPHLFPDTAYALMIGSTTMKMKGAPKGFVAEMRAMAKQVRENIPACFEALTWESDAEKLHLLARDRDVRVSAEETGWRQWNLRLTVEGEETSILGLKDTTSQEAAERVALELNEYLAQLRDLGGYDLNAPGM